MTPSMKRPEVFVPYRLVRSRARRRLSLVMTPQGELEARAPMRLSVERIEAFIRASADWIEWAKAQADAARAAFGQTLLLEDGGFVLFRGAKARLCWGKSTRAVLNFPGGREIWLKARDGLQAEKELHALLKREARSVIDRAYAKMAVRAKRLPVKFWKLSSSRSRWGSASAARATVNLSWRLVFIDDALIEYVVAHELAHLVEANHSQAFWKEVEAILPDWKRRHQALRAVRMELLPFYDD